MRHSFSLLSFRTNLPSLPILSGVLLATVFFIPGSGWLTLVAVVPLFVFVLHDTTTPQRAALGGFFFGMIALGASILWFFDTHPLTWIGITNPALSFVLVVFVWGLSTITLAAGSALFGYVIARIRTHTIADIALVAVLWTIAEYIRAILFSLVWIAPESSTGAHWTFGFLGVPLADTFLLSWAQWGGFFMLSGIAALVNVMIAQETLHWKKGRALRARPFFTPLITLLLILIVGSILLSRNTEKTATHTLRTAIVHTDIPSGFGVTEEVFQKRLHDMHTFMSLLRSDGPFDLLVFPEDTHFLPGISKEERARILSSLLSEDGIAIDSATQLDEKGDLSLFHYFYTRDGEIQTFYRKRFLVPFGELLPLIIRIPAMITTPDWEHLFASRRAYSAAGFNDTLPLGSIGETNIAALFCSEIIPEGLYERATKEGADVLVNTASHSVFGKSPLLSLFTVRQAQVHAASLQTLFIHAGNGVASFVIDETGQLSITTPKHTSVPTVLIIDIALSTDE